MAGTITRKSERIANKKGAISADGNGNTDNAVEHGGRPPRKRKRTAASPTIDSGSQPHQEGDIVPGNGNMYHSVGTQTHTDVNPARRRRMVARWLDGTGPGLSAGPVDMVMADDEDQESPAILLTANLLENIQAAIQADRELYQDTLKVERKHNYRVQLREAFQRKREEMDRDEATIKTELRDIERPDAGTRKAETIQHWKHWLQVFDRCREDINAHCEDFAVEEHAEAMETERLKLQHLIASNNLHVILDDVFVKARIISKLVEAEPEHLPSLDRYAVLQEWHLFEEQQETDQSSAEGNVEERADPEIILNYGPENSQERSLMELERQADRGIDPIRRDQELRDMWTKACDNVQQFRIQLAEVYAEYENHRLRYENLLGRWKHSDRTSKCLQTRSQFDRNYLLVGRDITQAITKAENDLAVAVATARGFGLHFDSDGGSFIEEPEVTIAEVNEWGEASIDRIGLQEWVDQVQFAESESAEGEPDADEWGAQSVGIHESNSLVDDGIYKRRLGAWKRQCNELRSIAAGQYVTE